MTYNSKEHHRRSVRLKGYDYSQKGGYFMTIVTQNRECLYGNVVDGEMMLNDAGTMIKKRYLELENKFPDIRCDEYVIMPNHFHAIIHNVGADLCVCPTSVCPTSVCPTSVCPKNKSGEHTGSGEHHLGEHTGSPLHKVVQWFKTMTTNEYIRRVKQNKWRSFNGKLWQRNYYEHVIRNEDDFNRVREYIINNPLQWELDDENPNNPYK